MKREKNHDASFKIGNQRGVSVIEQILILVIITLSATLAFNTMRSGGENKSAKQALDTAKQIGQAVRLYEINTGGLPTQADLSELEDKGYIKADELSEKNAYTYTFVSNGGDPAKWSIQATNGTRTLSVKNNDGSFDVHDSSGLYNH